MKKYPPKSKLYFLIHSILVFAESDDLNEEHIKCCFCNKESLRSDSLHLDKSKISPGYCNFMGMAWTWYWEVLRHICAPCQQAYRLLPEETSVQLLEKLIRNKMKTLWYTKFAKDIHYRELNYLKGDKNI